VEGPLSRAERTELQGIIRRNFRVARSGVDQRKAALMADFEEALAREWEPLDTYWQEVVQEAERAVEKVNRRVQQRFAEMGWPQEWAPHGYFGMSYRGENQLAARRAELRRVAQTRADDEARKAKLVLERKEVELLTELATSALTSAAAQQFLSQIPDLVELMPPLSVEELPGKPTAALEFMTKRADLSAIRAEAGRLGGRANRKQIAAPAEQKEEATQPTLVQEHEGRPRYEG
jgi:hypothetical protein